MTRTVVVVALVASLTASVAGARTSSASAPEPVRLRENGTQARPGSQASQPQGVPPLDRVVELLRSPVAAQALSIRAVTRVLPGSSPATMDLIVAADIGRSTGPQDVAVGVVLSEAGGRVVASGAEQRRLEPQPGPDRSGPLRFTGLLQAPPGRYRLKMAAVDAAGQAGTFEREVEVAVTEAGPLLLGDLVLVSAGTAGLGQGLSLDDSVAAGAARAFIQMGTKDQTAPSAVRVTIEVADTAGGRALVSAPLPIGRAASGALYADGPIDLRLLPPGEYHARAVVTIDGRTVGTRSAPLRIAAGPSPAAAAGAARPAATLAIGSDRLLVRPFDVKDVLRPEVVRFFVERLASVGGPPTPATSGVRDAVRAGDFDKARVALGTADDRLLDTRFLRGLALLAAQSLEPASAEFRAALKVNSEFLPAAFYLGACYAAGGNDREAVGAWQMALVSESDAQIVYEVLVDALLRIREVEQAGDFMREALDRWRADDTFRPRAAAVALAKGDHRGALDLLDAHIEAHPTDATSLFLAMRAVFEARSGGRTVRGAAEDAAAMARYAGLYEAAKGPDREIVARWLAFVQRREP